jgi:glycosyltransferase involved in cell wall biosynthesis
MKILFLSNTPFLPATAGNRARIDELIAYLVAEGAEVAMLMLPEIDRASWDEDGMRRRLARFEVAEPSPARRVATRVRRLVGAADEHPARPVGVDDWCPDWFRQRAARFAAEWRPDAVVAEYVFLSACLDGIRSAVPDALGVIDTHDVMHLRRDAYAAAGLTPRWFHTSYDEERRGLERADLVLAVHESEAEILRRLIPDREVLVVPHGRAVRPAPLERAEPARLLLVASYNDINVKGLEWFLEEVWPELHAELPALRLVVCGTIAEKMSGVPPGVSIEGVMPSLADEYARARVVVNPVPSTTGIQVKTAEALCHGRPVVTTRAGTAGFDAGAGVVAAATAAEFRSALARVLSDEALWARLAAEATAYARRHLTPAAAFGPLMSRLARPRRPAGA